MPLPRPARPAAPRRPRALLLALLFALVLAGCTTQPETPPAPLPAAPVTPAPAPAPITFGVQLGIDTLEQNGFAPLRSRRVGLLTHTAAVNRRGTPTWQVLHRAPGVRLVALYAPEHGLEGTKPANERFGDLVHPPTGLPLYSVYGRHRKPTAEMLRGIDVLVVDLQDIGSRSYTFISAMRLAIEASFEQGKEVVVLDRPNPLGGLKVDGPPLDRELMSYVGAFRVPYVHGLTIGELALLAKNTPGVLQVPERLRLAGQLTVVPMQGWRRAMRWPDTGLRFLPTSPFVQDFAATVGYAMTGLGCELSGFSHGVGRSHAFRTLQFRGVTPERLQRELEALRLPGLGFRIVQVQDGSRGPVRTVFVDVVDWEKWNPTELSFHLHVLAARLAGRNPFAGVPPARADLFNKHVGSQLYWNALSRQGARTPVAQFVADWQRQAREFQQSSRRFWLYR